MENLRFVIVGHIDHGKSTLIGRLLLDTNSLSKEKYAELKKISQGLGKETMLAFLSDQLKEEREQEKSIDTTQIFFKTRRRNYVIIDTPGHLEFIKNMITGASLAQAAILIVDAKEGIMEQTRRHAHLIKMLGIDQLIVAFNKMDLIDYNKDKFEELKNELLLFLKNLDLIPSFFVPISAKEGVNISERNHKTGWYKGPHLLNAIDSLRLKRDAQEKPLRFPVQDVYEVNQKQVIVGRVESGRARKGARVILLPSGRRARINSLMIFKEENKTYAEAGENIGLVLDNPSSVRRGEVIVEDKNPPRPTSCFKGNIFWMSEKPLKVNETMALRCATQEVGCCVDLIEKRLDSSTLDIIEKDAGELRLNESASVIFRTEEPIIMEKFSFIEGLGRFVIEEGYYLRGMGIVIEESI